MESIFDVVSNAIKKAKKSEKVKKQKSSSVKKELKEEL